MSQEVDKSDPLYVPPVTFPEDMSDEEKTFLRESADLEMKTALGLRDVVFAEMIASQRWVQTSLLLVNGAAATAMVSLTGISAHVRTVAGAIFVSGITFALLTALLGHALTKDEPRRIHEIAGYWLSVKLDLFRSEETEREFKKWSRRARRRGWWTQGVGALSFLCFICGCGIIGNAFLG